MKLRNTMVKLVLIVALLAVALTGTGCFMKRDVVVINADETAFAVPLSGDTNNQAQLYSKENLAKGKVTAKRVFVDYERVKTRTGEILGKWYPKTMVIKVSLRPETRAWTGAVDSGTAAVNQALIAETQESIRLAAEFNCNAAVAEDRAADFVSSYYGKQLSEVMDTQIRPYAQQLFTEESAKYTMDEFLANKSKITKAVRDGVTKKFAEQGIVIMTLGMQGDIQWDPKIQESIDTRIRANNEYLANQARNKQKVEAATAASREAKLLSGETAMKIRQLEIEKIKAETQREAAAKWDGKLPVQMVPGGATPFVNVGK
jgi:hypothetical protein